MRFMMMIKCTSDFEAGAPPSPGLLAGMAKLTDEMVKAGVLLSAEGLMPSSHGARLKYADGKRALIDGPFAETKELIGGFAILKAKSKDEAVALAERVLQVHIEAGITDFEMEIRPLFEPQDFAPPER